MTASAPAPRPAHAVIGRGGLLGSAVAWQANAAGDRETVQASPFEWSSPRRLGAQFEDLLTRLGAQVDDSADWRVHWCAGTGHVGASEDDMRRETERLALLAAHLDRLPPGGTVSFASSAGALYAGVTSWPATEKTEIHPTHPYGFAKQEQEALLGTTCARLGHRLVIHRISNLFGMDPASDRPRGLIGHLVRNTLTRVPSNIFVPVSFSRDYIHASDAASLMLYQTGAPDAAGSTSRIRLVAAEQNHTVLDIITTLSRMMKRTIPFVERPTPESRLQPPILAFRSIDSYQRALVRVPLENGLRGLIDEYARRR